MRLHHRAYTIATSYAIQTSPHAMPQATAYGKSCHQLTSIHSSIHSFMRRPAICHLRHFKLRDLSHRILYATHNGYAQYKQGRVQYK